MFAEVVVKRAARAMSLNVLPGYEYKARLGLMQAAHMLEFPCNAQGRASLLR